MRETKIVFGGQTSDLLIFTQTISTWMVLSHNLHLEIFDKLEIKLAQVFLCFGFWFDCSLNYYPHLPQFIHHADFFINASIVVESAMKQYGLDVAVVYWQQFD